MWGQKQSAMIAEAMIVNFSDKNKFTITKGMDNIVREHKNGFSFIFFSDDVIEKSYNNGIHYLNEESAKKIIYQIKKGKKDFLEFVKKEKKELLVSFKEYRKQIIYVQKLYRASDPSSTKLLEDKIRKVLNDDEFIIASTPIKLDLIQQEIIDFSKLEKKEKDLLKHIKKYPGNFCNIWTYKEMKKLLVNRIDNREKIDVKKILANKQNLKIKQKEIFKKYPEIKFSCKLLQDLATTRLEIKHAWSGAETLCLDLLMEIAKKSNLDFSTFMKSHNFTDTLKLLEKGEKLTEDEINDRLSYTIVHYNKNKLKYLYGEEAEKYFNKLKKIKKNLKGLVANKGKVTGKVRIIHVEDIKHLEKDIIKFKKGEILVTTMTSPAMVPLANKASAIITNEGGICSHAAIISRELGIPCIVGTHDATRILKDGDIVEINNGIITKK